MSVGSNGSWGRGAAQHRLLAAIVGLALTVSACSGGSDSSAADVPADVEAPTEVLTATPEPTNTPVATLEPTEVPTLAPELAPVATPTTSAVASIALPDPRSIGDLVAAPLGTFMIARPDAGFPLGDDAAIVPVYDQPGGEPRVLVDTNNIDLVNLEFPLRNPTVFRQPLVLRVLSGTQADEWILVQAPTRPHRRHVWVRASDFEFGHTDLRIEVDLQVRGRFALIDGDRELITNDIVYGREARPTVLHDTYVEQAFDATVLSPAYGTYILTLASYSETLGSFGGGMPGQSLHGTNQPELMGQRVSSGGIRVPDEVIDFVYAQPELLGASVIIYDSSGIGREDAIARQRNKAWSPALTRSFDPANPPKALVTSYS